LIEVDSIGKLKRVIRELPFQKGSAVHLTLDYDIQRAAEEELAKTGTKRGAAVALDLKTGAILAWASAPTFDPLGSLAEGLSDPNLPFFDRVYKGAYPPGSLFKIVTAIAGLEKGVIRTSEKIECVGYVMLPDKSQAKDRKFKCWKRHGWVDFWRAVSESCDSYFYLLGKKLGPQAMYDVARQFGMGQSAESGFPGENLGNVPNSTWKKKVGLGGWSTGDTYNMAIGQGYITATPLQMAVMIAGVGTSGQIFKPYMVEKVVDPNGVATMVGTPTLQRTITLKQQTWDTIHQALKGVVEEGTASGVQIPYLDMGGKTGTAQNPHGEDHAWFAAYAGYKDEPPSIAVCVFVENGGHGGVVAAPIAKRMLQVALPDRTALPTAPVTMPVAPRPIS
jgi:penicillin-binding protein 2